VDGRERIISVDPGLMTGVALLTRNNDKVERTLSDEVKEHELAPWLRQCLKDWKTLEGAGVRVTVVYERFTITQETARLSQAPWSLEMIGVLKQVMRDHDYPVELAYGQRPGEAKNVVDNKKLRRLELWHVGGAGHANDALRHGVLNLINRGWRDPRFLKA
jgi:hypothetical protein